MTTHRLAGRSWLFTLLLYLCFIYLPFIISRADSAESFIRGDSYYYRAVIDSLLTDHDLLVANNISGDSLNGQLAMGKEGLVPKHPILLSLVSMPFYSLFGSPGLLLFNIFDSMILMGLIFKLNCFFFNQLIAFITTILYATGTLFLDYMYSYSPDIFSTVLLLTGLYLTLQNRFYLSAVFLGLSIFAKLPNAPLVGAILLYTGFMIAKGNATGGGFNENVRKRILVITVTAIIFVIGLAPYAYVNYLLFGSPIVTGYQRTALADAQGQVVLIDHVSMFNQPLLRGVSSLLFDPRNGIILTNPILILALLGTILIRKIKPTHGAYLILAICLIQFIFFAKYDDSNMSDFSNRFLMTFIALSSVFTSNFLNYLSVKFALEASITKQFL